MKYSYKTIFVPSLLENTSIWEGKIPEINGDDFSRNIQACIMETQVKGYDFHSIQMTTASKLSGGGINVYTNGAILVFQKEEK